MTQALQYIKDKAKVLGACEEARLDSITNEAKLIQLLFTPQGREFCKRHRFPSVRAIRALAPSKYIIQEDMPKPIRIYGNKVFVGCRNSLRISARNRLHRVILMHGAELDIEVGAYCAVTICQIGNDNRCTVQAHETAAVDYD